MLSAGGVVLQPLRAEDAPALFIALSEAKTQRYRRQAPHREVGETVAYVHDTLRRGLGWAITTEGGEALGRIALRKRHDGGEIGIVLRAAAQRRGLGSAALALVKQYAFENLGYCSLVAEIDCENEPSLRLFVGAGFSEGVHERALATTHLGLRAHVTLATFAESTQ
jgi:RimJ/RimL family protein N-acetyltransferase